MMSELDGAGSSVNPFDQNLHLTLEDSSSSADVSPLPPGKNSSQQNRDVPLMGDEGDIFGSGGRVGAVCMNSNTMDMHAKLDSLRQWSISTYKCTKQAINEKLGKAHRTVDLELEMQIEGLRETQRRYAALLVQVRAFASHFQNMSQTQKQMAEMFSEMATREPQLREEFGYNADTQKTIIKNGEALLSAINFFISSLQTLCEKTIEDTLITVRNYETARLAHDAYRADFALMQQNGGTGGFDGQSRLREAELNCEEHKRRYEQLRDDVQVKIRFLDENRVKVVQKQLLLFHNSLSAFFSGNQKGLEASLKQFSITTKIPQNEDGSFLEK